MTSLAAPTERLRNRARRLQGQVNHRVAKYSPDQARDHLGRWVTSLTGRAADEAVRLTRDKGGFTFTMGRGKLAFPRTGYALSLWPEHTLVLDAEALRGQGRPAARRKLVSWIKANKELLAKPGMHVGGWHNTKTGKAYIDISVVYPKGQLDKALSHARKANQIAIWSLHDSDEIAVGGTGEALHKGVPSNSWPPSTASSSPPRGSPTTTRMRKTWPTPSSTPWGLTTTRSHQRLAELIDKFDPEQPRDAQGRWTVVGAGGYPKRNPDDRTETYWSEMSHEQKRDWDGVFRAWDDITRDDPHQDEPARVFPERYVDNREHFPKGLPGIMVLRSGQVETRIRRAADGGAELYDMTPLAPGLTFDDIPKGAKVDMSGGEGGRPLVEVAGSSRPPSFSYRLVAAEEWDQALARGFFQSDGRLNLGADEGTVMSSVSTGSFYLPKTGHARIIRFRHDPAWKLDPNDSYIKTQSRIPLDQVDRVTGLIETEYISKAAHHLGELLSKYNKNHDKVGRFARASGSGGSSELPPGDWDSHPTEWAKHTFEMQGDGWTTRVEAKEPYTGSRPETNPSFMTRGVAIRGHIFSSDHQVMGSFERMVDTDNRTVTHEILIIKPSHQGKGIAEAFNAHAEEAYRAAGIDTIKLTANITVGGYAWAKAGYDWDGEGEDGGRYDLEQLVSVYRRNRGNTRPLTEDAHVIAPNFRNDDSHDALRMAVRAVARDHHAELVTPEVVAKAEELARIPGRLRPQDVARLGYDQGAVVRGADGRRYWLGKLLLLGSYWEGTKELRSLAMAKYNKNHDARGRFARKAGSGGTATATLERPTTPTIGAPPEGNWDTHPHEWTKHTYEAKGDDWSTEASYAGNGMVYGSIFDAWGAQIGKFERRIMPGAEAVDHHLLVIKSDFQGQGIAEAFNAHAEAAYRQAGIREITLFANINVGGYAWAKAGYNWDKPGSNATLYDLIQLDDQYKRYGGHTHAATSQMCPTLSELRDDKPAIEKMLEEHHAELLTPAVAARVAQLVKPPEGSGGPLSALSAVVPFSAQEVAKLGYDEGAIVTAENGQRYWLGKLMLLGTQWHGSKKLQAPAMAKYDPSQPRDRRGRWSASGGRWGAGGALGSVAAPTDVGHDPQDDALLQTRRKMQTFAAKMKPSKDWEERKAAIAELKQPGWHQNPNTVNRIGGRILQEAHARTEWTLMAHSNFKKQITQLHAEIENQSAKLHEQMITSPKGVADLKADIAKRQHRLKDLQDKSKRIDQLRFADHVRAILDELHPMGGKLRVESEDMPPGGDHTWAPARVVHAVESMVPTSWVEWANRSHQYPTSVTMTDRGGMAGAFNTRNNHIMVNQHLSHAMQESTALHEFGHLMQLHPLLAEAETAYVHDRLGPTPRAVGAELTSGEVAYLMENPDKPWGNPYSGRLYEGPRKAMTAYGRETAEHRNTDGRTWNGGKRGILHEVLTTGLQHMLDPYDEQYDHDLAKWATGMLMLDIHTGDLRRTEG